MKNRLSKKVYKGKQLNFYKIKNKMLSKCEFVYKIGLVGPTGAGKSQLCNFILRDHENKTFMVSDSIDSGTKIPQSKVCVRNDTAIEIIDTAGCNDSQDDDEKNLRCLINNLKEKKNVEFFLLVLNFTDRLDGKTRDFLKLLRMTFTPKEFFTHMAVVFTHFPENPTEKQKKKKEQKKKEISQYLIESFGIKNEDNLLSPNVYELDTESDDDGNFIEKFQKTIDVIIDEVKIKYISFGSVSTKDIELSQEKVNSRIEAELKKIEELKKEAERKKKEFEELEKKRMEALKKKEEEERKRIENEIREMENERRRREEEAQRRFEEANRIANHADENIKQHNITVEKVNNGTFIGNTAKVGGALTVLGTGALLVTEVITGPVAVPAALIGGGVYLGGKFINWLFG